MFVCEVSGWGSQAGTVDTLHIYVQSSIGGVAGGAAARTPTFACEGVWVEGRRQVLLHAPPAFACDGVSGLRLGCCMPPRTMQPPTRFHARC
jgi:hypothetical protein